MSGAVVLGVFAWMLWRARSMLVPAAIVGAGIFVLAFVGLHSWWTFWRVVGVLITGGDVLGSCHLFACP